MAPSTTSIHKQRVHFGWSPSILSLQRLPWPFSVHWFSNHGLVNLRPGIVARIAWTEPERKPDAVHYADIIVSIYNTYQGLVIENRFSLGDYVAGIEESNSAIDAYLRVSGNKAQFVFSDNIDEPEDSARQLSQQARKKRMLEETRDRMAPLCEAVLEWLSILYGRAPFGDAASSAVGSVGGGDEVVAGGALQPNRSRMDVPTDELPIVIGGADEHEHV